MGYPTAFLKTVKVTRSKEGLRKCHGQEESER